MMYSPFSLGPTKKEIKKMELNKKKSFRKFVENKSKGKKK